jgi:hypothetical protein
VTALASIGAFVLGVVAGLAVVVLLSMIREADVLTPATCPAEAAGETETNETQTIGA